MSPEQSGHSSSVERRPKQSIWAVHMAAFIAQQLAGVPAVPGRQGEGLAARAIWLLIIG